MMLMGPIGMAVFPPEFFGIGERCSIYAAIGFEAVLGVYLFNGFKKTMTADTADAAVDFRV